MFDLKGSSSGQWYKTHKRKYTQLLSLELISFYKFAKIRVALLIKLYKIKAKKLNDGFKRLWIALLLP